jgi:hypothetical protein
MKTSITQAKNRRLIVGRVVMPLAFVAMLVGLSTGPALSQDRDRRYGEQERGTRERHDRRDWREHRRYVRPAPPVVYAPPPVVYAPPSVVYAPPPPSPGISLIFPIHIR